MDNIRQILSHYPHDCHARHISPLDSAGGLSGAKFWRITANRGPLALRRWPVESPPADRLAWIHAVLRHASRKVDFLPVPLNTTSGQTFVESAGHLWELAPWMPGTANYESSPTPQRLNAAMTALASFHHATADSLPPYPALASPQSAVPRRITRLQALAAGELAELAVAIRIDVWPELVPTARQFLSLVPRAIPTVLSQLEAIASAELPLQPCIRDVWHDHILFTGDRVTGLVDFGAMEIDTPATDIARLLGSLTGESSSPFRVQPIEPVNDQQTWRAGLAAYELVHPLSHEERKAAAAIETANPILAGCNWLRWLYVDKRQFADPGQILARFQRIVRHLALTM